MKQMAPGEGATSLIQIRRTQEFEKLGFCQYSQRISLINEFLGF